MQEHTPPRVVIGMDPHKRSVTIEAMGPDEAIVGRGRFDTDQAGYQSMVELAHTFSQRVWAIEGRNAIGRHVADGEQVIGVPPKLSARVRTFATGQGCKTDATDAHSIALVDRAPGPSQYHTRMVCQLHHPLLELIPGGAKKDLSAAQAKKLLATVRPRDTAGKTRRRVAAKLVSDLERIYTRKKAANKELTALLTAAGHHPDRPARYRPLRRGPAPGRGR